jgi:hypothetical protein
LNSFYQMLEGVVIDDTLLRIDPMGPLDLAVEPRSRRVDVDVADPAIEDVVVERAWNSPPLSVWITSTLKGSFPSTQSRNRIALCWLSRS